MGGGARGNKSLGRWRGWAQPRRRLGVLVKGEEFLGVLDSWNSGGGRWEALEFSWDLAKDERDLYGGGKGGEWNGTFTSN